MLDAALYLCCFCGFVAEFFYEVLYVGNFFLLVFVGSYLAFASFGPELDIFIVFYFVVYNSAARYLYGPVCYIVDECPVVAYQYNGVGFALQKVFQPLYAFDVEMVCRLVEQEHVGVLQQQLGQFDAHAPSAAEFACAAVEIGAFESQSCQGAFHVGASVLCSGHLQAFCQMAAEFYQGVVFLAFIVFALGQCAVDALELAFHIFYFGKGRFGLFDESFCVGQLHHLRQVAYGQAA